MQRHKVNAIECLRNNEALCFTGVPVDISHDTFVVASVMTVAVKLIE